MKGIISLIGTLLIVCTLMIPTSAYASSATTQTNSTGGFFLTISYSDLFSFFKNENKIKDFQYNSSYSGGHEKDNWWDSFCMWWNSRGHNSGGTDDECKNDKYSWGNDDGCLDSAEIWKRWYCN
ncbi:hypothetical protein COJ96_10005 [Bacillus sp. AFS073361]|nr:hypothetical protein COJ96_10005 [Bacillus sp. AFS073361]